MYKQGQFWQIFFASLGFILLSKCKVKDLFTMNLNRRKPNETTHIFNYLVNTTVGIEGISASFFTYMNNHVWILLINCQGSGWQTMLYFAEWFQRITDPRYLWPILYPASQTPQLPSPPQCTEILLYVRR